MIVCPPACTRTMKSGRIRMSLAPTSDPHSVQRISTPIFRNTYAVSFSARLILDRDAGLVLQTATVMLSAGKAAGVVDNRKASNAPLISALSSSKDGSCDGEYDGVPHALQIDWFESDCCPHWTGRILEGPGHLVMRCRRTHSLQGLAIDAGLPRPKAHGNPQPAHRAGRGGGLRRLQPTCELMPAEGGREDGDPFEDLELTPGSSLLCAHRGLLHGWHAQCVGLLLQNASEYFLPANAKNKV